MGSNPTHSAILKGFRASEKSDVRFFLLVGRFVGQFCMDRVLCVENSTQPDVHIHTNEINMMKKAGKSTMIVWIFLPFYFYLLPFQVPVLLS